MDDIREVMRSQSLVDSMHELIENQKDVVNALGYTANSGPPSRVMLPVTGVAFMPGTIIGGSVMVGLGDDYYVERTYRQAKDILERRTLDLKRNVTAVAAKGALIFTAKSAKDAQKAKQRAKNPPVVSWKKGFLSPGPSVHDSQQDQNPTKNRSESARGHHSGSPQEANSKRTLFEDSVAQEDQPTEEIEETPIMDIREWLDDSEREISVDVTDLGKVLGKPQRAATEIASSPQNVSIVGVKGSSDLDTIFDRLEEQESKAEERGKVSHQSLGPSWKKGFLDGCSASRPEGSTINNRNVEMGQATKADSPIHSSSTESAQAFRDSVIEKPVTVVHNTSTRRTSAEPAGAPSNVSRFKARRQGLQ